MRLIWILAVSFVLGLSLPAVAGDAGVVIVPAMVDGGAGSADGSTVVAAPVAPAATPAPIPDPTEAPGEALSMMSKLYKSGAWIGLAILASFFTLSIAAKRVAWLKEGRRAVYCSAALGGLALLTVPASQGTTPNLSMVVAAVIAAMTLALNPTKPSETKPAG